MNPDWSVGKKQGAAEIGTAKKILYVDDDKDWRDVVSATFQDAGHEILTPKDATQARLLAGGVKLDLIMMR